MLRPSYSELINILNESNDVDSKIVSRYTIVIAAAKRARQIIAGEQPLTEFSNIDKPVSIAVKEMAESKLKITSASKIDNRDILNNGHTVNTKEVDNLDTM